MPGRWSFIAELLALLTLLAAPAAAASRRPSVVLIVADDLGYSDLGCYGGEIDTPSLDALAAGGVRLTHFYATPRCSPSRAALLTGVWAHAAGVGHLNDDWRRPGYRGRIDPSIPTLAERLREEGYATAMVGKWHLAPNPVDLEEEAADPPGSWPLERGFDSFYGTLRGSGSYFAPPTLLDGDRPVAPSPLAAGAGSDRPYYYTDEIGRRAQAFLERHQESEPERPFFLYVAFTAPHWPLHALPEEIAAYEGRFDAGWDALREARLERQRRSGIAGAQTELARDPHVAPWADVSHKAWQLRRMEVYAAMVTAMDRAVGRIVDALARRNLLENTLVLFLSDNGASSEEFRRLYRLGRYFLPVPERTARGERVRFGDDPEVPPGGADTFATYGRGWAHLSATPLRLYKTWAHEGGIAVPFIVHWPRGLAGRTGALIAEPAHVIDVAPTLLAAAGAPAPGSLEGRSLLALLAGEPLPERALYWEHAGNRGVRSGPWKLVSRWPRGWELYNLERDRTEQENLADEEAMRVEELEEAWRAWAREVGVGLWPLVMPEVRIGAGLVAAVPLLLVLQRWARRRRRRKATGTPP